MTTAADHDQHDPLCQNIQHLSPTGEGLCDGQGTIPLRHGGMACDQCDCYCDLIAKVRADQKALMHDLLADDVERARAWAVHLEQHNAHLREVLLQVMNLAETTLYETS